VYSHSPDIIGVTETWLSDKIFDNKILPSNYTIICKDHDSRGGGVMFTVKSSKLCQVYSYYPPQSYTLSALHAVHKLFTIWMLYLT